MPRAPRLLHVEDDPDIQFLVQMALVDLGGFEVMHCLSGAEAVERAPAFAPELMILDYMMPGMNGLATLHALRRLPGLGSVPAVFMTAKPLDITSDEMAGLGVVGVISKPFDPVALPAQVTGFLAKGRG